MTTDARGASEVVRVVLCGGQAIIGRDATVIGAPRTRSFNLLRTLLPCGRG